MQKPHRRFTRFYAWLGFFITFGFIGFVVWSMIFQTQAVELLTKIFT